MGKFKKGDLVYRWAAHGRVDVFTAKEVKGTKVQHPHGAWIESFENIECVKTELFTKEEMIQEVFAASVYNQKLLSQV